jgi:hypothetical protein
MIMRKTGLGPDHGWQWPGQADRYVDGHSWIVPEVCPEFGARERALIAGHDMILLGERGQGMPTMLIDMMDGSPGAETVSRSRMRRRVRSTYLLSPNRAWCLGSTSSAGKHVPGALGLLRMWRLASWFTAWG